MACDQETRLLISCYADGEATPEETACAQAHLSECSQCLALIREWQEQHHMLEWTYTVKPAQEADLDWEQITSQKERYHHPSSREGLGEGLDPGEGAVI